MGEKDIAEKILLAHNDVFSDIVNVLLFGGQEVIQENDLEDQTTISVYKADEKLHEIDRDVAKRWKSGNLRLACMGFENQTSSDSDMPLRVIAYDGMEYRAQLLKKPSNKANEEKETDKLDVPNKPAEPEKQDRYPVITMVLYFGYDHLWNGPISLKDRLRIPDGLSDYVNDYKINLYQIAYLPDEQIQQFKSDFRVVAEFFSQKRKQVDYTPSNQQLRHVKEVLQLFSIMTDDNRFEEIYNEELKKEGGIKTMCDVLDRAIEKGRKSGLAEGLMEGRSDGIRNMIELCQDLGTTEEAAQSQIIMRFHIQEDEAIKYIKTFWRPEKK